MGTLRDRLNQGQNFEDTTQTDFLISPSLKEPKEESQFTGSSLRSRLNGNTADAEQDSRLNMSVPDKQHSTTSLESVVPLQKREDDPAYVEYYRKRMIPVPDNVIVSQSADMEERKSRYEKTKESFDSFRELTDAELSVVGEAFAEDIERDLKATSGYRAADPFSPLMQRTVTSGPEGTKAVLLVAEAITGVMSGTLDGIETGLTYLKSEESGPIGDALYDAINTAVSGGRYAKSDDPSELTDAIGDNFGAASEFLETIPAIGSLMTALNNARTIGKYNKKLKPLKKKAQDLKDLEAIERYSPERAAFATREADEAARVRAASVAEKADDIKNDLILDLETRLSERAGEDISVSSVVGGKLELDYDKARDVGRSITKRVYEAERRGVTHALTGGADLRMAELGDIDTGTDFMTTPILKPEKFDGMVAVASDFKKQFPDQWSDNKSVIDNLFDLTINDKFKEEVGAAGLLDKLNDYGLSFEDYTLSIVGSASDAGKILNKLSQIKRARPMSVREEAATKAIAEAQGNIRKAFMRIENIRRGGMVTQIATAMRNLQSATIRNPLEGLGNVMDTALYRMSNDGIAAGVKSVASPQNWKDSFMHMKYIYSRPDIAKGFTDLILKRPEFEQQYNRMLNTLNEIHEATGRGSGTRFDKVMSVGEDAVDGLNIVNRWQEYLVRRGVFFGELERLTRREYGIDLMGTLQKGSLRDLINDAGGLKPAEAPSFKTLVDEAVTRAMDITYAKSPEVGLFKSANNFIVRNGLTVFMPFPRFMFNSMELLGQYAGGASIPLTRKVIGLVDQNYRGPLTAKDRQRIGRNVQGFLVGATVGVPLAGQLLKDEDGEEGSLQNRMSDALMSMASVGAAYQMRMLEDAPADYKMVSTGERMMDTSAQFPARQFLYLGEATKRLIEGTFGDWFESREFMEVFAGANLRTGTGNVILDEVAALTQGTDLETGEKVGRTFGRLLGNYLSSWAVPLAQVIEAQRATGMRGDVYKDTREDPTLDGMDTFLKEVTQPFDRMGYTLSPEEEAALPEREFLYSDEKKRPDPLWKVMLGINLNVKDDEYGEYLTDMGIDKYDLGLTSKVGSIDRYETKILREQLPTLVDAAQAYELQLRSEYKRLPLNYRNRYSENKHVSLYVKPLITSQVRQIRADMKEGKLGETSEYVRALMDFRKLPKAQRQSAAARYLQRNNKVPDITKPSVLRELYAIGDVLKEFVE